jgi:HAMP domain-containing protein
MKFVPSLMYEQVNLRTYSISRSLGTAIQQPLLIKNYLLVNKMAETNANLPGVAYVSVLNKRGVVIAGILGDEKRFDPTFIDRVKESGFPKEISTQNRIPSGKNESAMDYSVGGQKIHDVAVMIGDTGGEAHVGLFTEDVERAVQKSLVPLLVFLGVIAFLGGVSHLLVARTISVPIRSLTTAAEKISLGEIDLPIEVRGGGEIGDLAASLERMRFSIKAAMNRLRRN